LEFWLQEIIQVELEFHLKKSACGTSTPLPLTHEGLGLFFALNPS
jgi:hypothetical protein